MTRTNCGNCPWTGVMGDADEFEGHAVCPMCLKPLDAPVEGVEAQAGKPYTAEAVIGGQP